MAQALLYPVTQGVPGMYVSTQPAHHMATTLQIEVLGPGTCPLASQSTSENGCWAEVFKDLAESTRLFGYFCFFLEESQVLLLQESKKDCTW